MSEHQDRDGGPARVMVVEDDAVLRRHFVEVLDAAEGLTVIGQADLVADALPMVAKAPDLALLDLGLPDGSGIRVIEEIRRTAPACKVLVITVFEDRESVVHTLRAGADGYILKDTRPDALIAHIQATLAGETPISARAAGHLLSLIRDEEAPVEAAHHPPLSPRERTLLELLARGQSRKEAARAMSISPFTVAEYVQSIYRKLSVRSRGQAVYEALQAGLIKLDDI